MSVKFVNTSQVPLALAVFLASDSYDKSEEEHTISATTLLKPVRQIILPLRIPQGMGLPNLGDMMASRIGTAVHDAIEHAWLNNPQAALEAIGYPQHVIDRIIINPSDEIDLTDKFPIYLEQRVSRKVGKWTVSGKYDFISEGRVQDFKTTGTYTYMRQTNTQKYIEQGSIYRWLNESIITDSVLDIHYIFTNWTAAQAKYDPKYPSNRFLTQSFDLMDVSATQQMITHKLAQIEQFIDADEDSIPECTDADLWRSDPKYKYYKNGDINSKRSTKNFDTMQEAIIYQSTSGGSGGAIKEVPGSVMACKYCAAFALCTQKDDLLASGDLTLN